MTIKITSHKGGKVTVEDPQNALGLRQNFLQRVFRAILTIVGIII